MVKKFVVCAVLMVAFFAMTGTASALDPEYYPVNTYSQTETGPGTGDKMVSGDSFTFDFTLDDTALDAGEEILTANLSVILSDNSDTEHERARIYVDYVDDSHRVYSSPDTSPIVSWSGNVTDEISDHTPSVIVNQRSGDFYLGDATLSGTFADNTANPDFFDSKLLNILLDSSTTSWPITFNLATDALDVGDIGPEDEISHAYLVLEFDDDASGDGDEWARYRLDLGTWSTSVEISGSGTNQEQVVPLPLLSDLLLNIDVENVLYNHNGQNVYGDFYLVRASIGGEYIDNPVDDGGDDGDDGDDGGGGTTPEPMSMLLFGMGLLGLAGFRKKKII